MAVPSGYAQALKNVKKIHPEVSDDMFYHTVSQRGMKPIHNVGVRLKGNVVHYPFDDKTGSINGKPTNFDWATRNPTVFKK